jgi:MFS family permease
MVRSRSRMFAALSVPGYRRFWSTGLISNIGTAMQGVTLDWFVFGLTHSGTAVGWTTGLQFAPVLLFGLWGGVLSDRYDRRRLLLIAQSLYAVQATVLAVVVLLGDARLWLLYALSFGLGCVFTVENPARLAFVTELVGGPLIPNAAGLNILSINAARLIGPAIAGGLIAVIGSGWVFAINAVSFGIVIAGLLSIRPGPRPDPGTRTPWAGAGRAGLRYVAGRPRLVAVFVIFGLASTFAVNFPTTMTLFAGRVFDTGSTGLGLMSTALAVGTIAGTLTAARRAAPSVRLVVLGAVWFGVTEAVAATAPTYAIFLALLVPAGFALMILNTAVSGYVQTEVTEAVRGRVMAVYTVITMGGTPIGSPIVGWMSQHAGVRWGMGAGAGVSIVAGIVTSAWLSRRLTRSAAAAGLAPGAGVPAIGSCETV